MATNKKTSQNQADPNVQSKKSVRVEPRLLKGFRDYLPVDALPLRELMTKIVGVFESFGFEPLETPTLEYADILTGKYGTEGDKLMYRFVDQGGRTVAMRYDHTVPLARVIAMNQNLPMPFKRYVLAPVWRAEKPQRGRLREFYQCDFDIVGSDEARADAEILAVAYQLLAQLGVKKFILRANHRGILDALMDVNGIAKNQIGGTLHAMDKFEKYGEESFVRDTQKLGLEQKQIDALLKLISRRGSAEKVLNGLAKSLAKHRSGSMAVKHLSAIVEHAYAQGVPEKFLTVDLGVVRGLDYYTGMVVESVIADLPLFGSTVGGGRYDKLVGIFSRRTIPAVGASLGLGRLFEALQELGLASVYRHPAKVMVAIFDQTSVRAAEKIAASLRDADINTLLFPGSVSKFDKQLKFADRLGIEWVVWQGPEELNKKIVALKNLKTREQTSTSFSTLARRLK